MNYLDTYFSRVNFFGENATERIKNSGIVAFEKWLAQSPFRVSHLSVERGYYFSGIIETSKDKEELKIMYLYVANDIPIVVGDIMTWVQDDGTIEKWLLLQEIHKVHPTYKTFQIIKCNFQLKWINQKGILKKSWAYAVSSVDSKVKSNFRMWHSLVSPQPNKFAEVIMPRPNFTDPTYDSEDINRLMRGTTFIIEDEGWTVIECDWTSVKGVIYMSLTESKVNYEYDDRYVNVADVDELEFPTIKTKYLVGEKIIPEYKDYIHNEWKITLTPEKFPTKDAEGHDITPPVVYDEENEIWIANAPWRSLTMTMHLVPIVSEDKDKEIEANRAVTKNFEITIYAEEVEFQGYIYGVEEIKLGRQEVYCLYDHTLPEKNNLSEEAHVYMRIKNAPEANNPPVYDFNKNSYVDVDPTTFDWKLPTLRYATRIDFDDILDPNHEHPITVILHNKYILETTSKNKIQNIVLEAVYEGEEQAYTKTVSVKPLW